MIHGMMEFALDQRLQTDTHFIEDWPLCRVQLMKDRRYPWLILIPRRENIREIYELDAPDRRFLTDEICRASRAMAHALRPAKINVAALGNVVAQLHVHVIGRRTDDAVWPSPVWGRGSPEAYAPEELAERVKILQSAFKEFK